MSKKILSFAAFAVLALARVAPVTAQSGYRAAQSGAAARTEHPLQPSGRAIAQKWKQHRASLGRRVAKDQCVKGGRLAHFEHGVIFWSASYGAHALLGAIASEWLAQGGASGGLGQPISDDYAVGASRRSDFEFGYVIWSNDDGTTVSAMYERCEPCADGSAQCGSAELCTPL